MMDSIGGCTTLTTESTPRLLETKTGRNSILTYIRGFSLAEPKRCLTATHVIQQPTPTPSAHLIPAESVLRLQTLLARVLKRRDGLVTSALLTTQRARVGLRLANSSIAAVCAMETIPLNSVLIQPVANSTLKKHGPDENLVLFPKTPT